tara:strand:- start:1221 stop:1445 length:225 start_codon:yes stop_codon:yes gene_type:complete
MNQHKLFCLTHTLLSLLDYETEPNGFTDSRQLLIWRVNGEEIGRSESGRVSVTPLFKTLVMEKLNEIYPAVDNK